MRRLAFVFILAAALAAAPAAQQTPVFRGTADNVPVFVTVTDKSGKLVTGLTKDAFEVRDNGKPQPITVFDNSPQPVRLTVLIDVSGSMRGNLPILRNGVTQLIAHLGPDDLARLGTFGHEITIQPQFSHDPVAILSLLPTCIDPDTPTPLWQAAEKAIGDFGDAEGRRVVLILSDSKDSPAPAWHQKYLSVLDVIDQANREDVMVYGVGMQSRDVAAGGGCSDSRRPGGSGGGFPGGGFPAGGNLGAAMAEGFPDPSLGKLADESGGGYLELRSHDDLSAAFAEVVNELHQQYLLGFTPAAHDGKDHKIEVRMREPNLKVRARRTYRAPK